MPSPQNGQAGNLVSPAAPRTAKDADNAVSGDAEKQSGAGQSKNTGGSGSAANSPASNKPASTAPVHKPDPTKTGWIEIAMVDEQGQPVTSLAYSITLPDGSVSEGTLGDDGVARAEGFDPGSCQITFPDLDQEAWEPK